MYIFFFTAFYTFIQHKTEEKASTYCILLLYKRMSNNINIIFYFF